MNENFSAMLDCIQPYKWTVVQLLPIFNKNLSISSEQFQAFVDTHIAYQDVMVPETNDDYNESFICVTPDGRFFSNGAAIETEEYKYSNKIIEVGAVKAFNQIGFSIDRYITRNAKCSKLSY